MQTIKTKTFISYPEACLKMTFVHVDKTSLTNSSFLNYAVSPGRSHYTKYLVLPAGSFRSESSSSWRNSLGLMFLISVMSLCEGAVLKSGEGGGGGWECRGGLSKYVFFNWIDLSATYRDILFPYLM